MDGILAHDSTRRCDYYYKYSADNNACVRVRGRACRRNDDDGYSDFEKGDIPENLSGSLRAGFRSRHSQHRRCRLTTSTDMIEVRSV